MWTQRSPAFRQNVFNVDSKSFELLQTLAHSGFCLACNIPLKCGLKNEMNCEMLWTASPRPLKKERKENQESVSLPSVQTLTSKQDKSGLRFTKYFKSNPQCPPLARLSYDSNNFITRGTLQSAEKILDTPLLNCTHHLWVSYRTFGFSLDHRFHFISPISFFRIYLKEQASGEAFSFPKWTWLKAQCSLSENTK